MDEGRSYKRIAVVGCGGAGKSTFSRRLGEMLDLPVIHLDAHFWRAGWVQTPNDEWDRKVTEFASAERWIIDGNYGRTFELRFAAADAVVFLDYPRYVCLWRAFKRRIVYRGATRPDMGPGCPESIDMEFFLWIWHFRRDSRPHVMEKLASHATDMRVHILRTPREAEILLRTLGQSKQEDAKTL